ncbi:MAG: thermonuclease family protein [Actinomycetota bacterium]|nr:thermonuclease family protein [Actinomycetota bacterium]
MNNRTGNLMRLLLSITLHILIILFVAVAAGCSVSDSNLSTKSKANDYETPRTGKVVRIIDGDTIEVRLTDGQVRKVRYIGIDTPERSEDLYTEATRANARLVDGKEVSLVKDISETDRYGRLLRYVYVGETFINAELVRQGYAAAATYPPDVAYADFFVKLAAEAREKGVGLWSDDTGRAPPETTLKKPQSQSLGAYIGNRNSRVFHLPSCRSLPAPHNQVLLASRDEAVRAGYSPCGICRP